MEGYITLKEASDKWGISERRIRTLCMEGRIKHASKLGSIIKERHHCKRMEKIRLNEYLLFIPN